MDEIAKEPWITPDVVRGESQAPVPRKPVETAVQAPPSRANRWKWAFLAILVLLIGACAYAGYVTNSNQTNKRRALDWATRAAVLQTSVERLQANIASRTRFLNYRTSLLNASLAKLNHARAEIRASQSDVGTLERRQRALANEKAQVEDEKAAAEQEASVLAAQTDALRSVASDYIDCNQQLIELTTHALNSDYTWIEVNDGTIAATCQTASSELQSYLDTYGG